MPTYDFTDPVTGSLSIPVGEPGLYLFGVDQNGDIRKIKTDANGGVQCEMRSHLRPVAIDEREGVFWVHGWVPQYAFWYAPDNEWRMGAGAIVEDSSGRVSVVPAESIRFTDREADPC